MSNTSRLIECYQYCSKYFSDNQASLQSCYRRCDAMWGSKTSASTDIKSFETCFPNSIYGLEDFMDKYRRLVGLVLRIGRSLLRYQALLVRCLRRAGKINAQA